MYRKQNVILFFQLFVCFFDILFFDFRNFSVYIPLWISLFPAYYREPKLYIYIYLLWIIMSVCRQPSGTLGYRWNRTSFDNAVSPIRVLTTEDHHQLWPKSRPLTGGIINKSLAYLHSVDNAASSGPCQGKDWYLSEGAPSSFNLLAPVRDCIHIYK